MKRTRRTSNARFRWRAPAAPDDLKGLAVLLASDAANFITGAIIPVDGGSTAW